MKINKFLFSTLIAAAAMTSTARATQSTVYVSDDAYGSVVSLGTVSAGKTVNYEDSVKLTGATTVKGTLIADKLYTYQNVTATGATVKANFLQNGVVSNYKLDDANPAFKIVNYSSARITATDSVFEVDSFVNIGGATMTGTTLKATNITDLHEDNEYDIKRIKSGAASQFYGCDITVDNTWEFGGSAVDFKEDSVVGVSTLVAKTVNNSASSNIRFNKSTLNATEVSYEAYSFSVFSLKNESVANITTFTIKSSDSKVVVENSELNAATLTNSGTITVSGVSTLNVGTYLGDGNVVVSDGAKVIVSSNLVDIIENNGGEIIVGRVVEGSSVALESNKAQTVIVAETGTVELSTSASGVVINKAEALNVADVAGISENLVAAWDFEITNENSEEITVSATIEAGLDVNTIKIWHGLEGGSWELLNENDGFEFDYNAESGKLTFSTNTFSPIVVSGSAAAPEPSAFGLLAGLGALALVASRRRRK